MNKLTALLMTVACACLLNAVLAETAAAPSPPLQGHSEERTLWSNILHAFGSDGTVNLTALISNLNDPNLNKLARSLGQANFTQLEKALSSPKVDIGDLMDALREYELLDDTKSLLNAEDNRFMGTLERWAAKLGDMRDKVFHTTRPLPEIPTKPAAPTTVTEQSPMLKKNPVQSADNDKQQTTEKETRDEPADSADSVPTFVREKKEAPHHKTYGGGSHFPHITVHSGGDKNSEEDGQTEEEWSLVVVWLIVCVGVAFGLLLGIVVFKLTAMLVSKIRAGSKGPSDAPDATTAGEPNSHFIAV